MPWYLRCFGRRACLEGDDNPVLSTPQPVLLLAYIAAHGEVSKQHIVNAFWPDVDKLAGFKHLSNLLRTIRQKAEGAIWASEDDVTMRYLGQADTFELHHALEHDDFELARGIYQGHFLEDLEHNQKLKVSAHPEVYEWLLAEREAQLVAFRNAVLVRAEQLSTQGNLDAAKQLAKEAYHLKTEHSFFTPQDFERLHTVLRACDSSLAQVVRHEGLQLYNELNLCTSVQEALQKLSTPNNLPQSASTLLGRDEALEECMALLRLEEVRLLNILGTAGIGKTHFATELARRLKGYKRFEDGVYVVWLEQVKTQEELIQSIARALNISLPGVREPLEALVDVLREKACLLYLDNAEHLRGYSGVLDAILQTCPHIKLLLSSREGLNSSWEHRYPLHGLAFPDVVTSKAEFELLELKNASPETFMSSLASYPAIKLFIEEGQKVQKSFRLTQENYLEVLEIVELSQGLPLALKLAAAWLDSTDTATLLSELKKSLEPLSQSQTGLSLSFDRSWARLNPKEQKVFAQVSVFVGGLTLSAAEAVLGLTLQDLKRLVVRSLLEWHPDTKRYTLHPMLQQFARQKLEGMEGLKAKVEERHAEYYLKELRVMTEGTPEEKTLAPKRLSPEFGNVEKAWYGLVTKQDIEALEKSCMSLLYLCDTTARLSEGERLFQYSINACEPLKNHALGILMACLAWQYFRLGLYTKAIHVAEQGLSLAKKHCNEQGTWLCFNTLGSSHNSLGNYDLSISYYKALLEIVGDNDSEKANALINISIPHKNLGCYSIAMDNLHIAQTIYERLNKTLQLNQVRVMQAEILIEQNCIEQAHTLLETTRMSAEQLDQGYFIPRIEYYLSQTLLKQNRIADAKLYVDRALKKAQLQHRVLLQADLLRHLASIFIAEKKLSDAVTPLSQSLTLTATHFDEVRFLSALVGVAQYYDVVGWSKQANLILSILQFNSQKLSTYEKLEVRMLSDKMKLVFEPEVEIVSLHQWIKNYQVLLPKAEAPEALHPSHRQG
jgi:predicted ATPase